MNELLTCEGLTKSYQKGTNALDNCSATRFLRNSDRIIEKK